MVGGLGLQELVVLGFLLLIVVFGLVVIYRLFVFVVASIARREVRKELDRREAVRVGEQPSL